jgi:hypothetical protein
LMSSHLSRSRRIKRRAKQSIEKRASGAGEGNRTLLFSLEVSNYRNVFKGHSDNSQPFAR